MNPAEEGKEALRCSLLPRVQEEGRPFDCVILDLTVPKGAGGRETIPWLLQIDPDVKAIVSSCYSNAPIMANYQEYGFPRVIA